MIELSIVIIILFFKEKLANAASDSEAAFVSFSLKNKVLTKI